MSLAVSLIFALIFAVVCQKPLKRFPLLFYVLAALVCAAGIYLTLYPNPHPAIRAIVFAIQKGHLGFAFFTLVMFIGVFDRNSSVRRFFTPIRAELSIMAGILIVGHLAPYLGNYFGYISSILSLQPSIMSSLIIALILLVLLVILVVTSFNFVKKKMDTGKWKAVQKLAYVFYILVFCHLLGFLLIPALGSSTSALINVGIYGFVFVLYLVLRVKRALSDKRQGPE